MTEKQITIEIVERIKEIAENGDGRSFYSIESTIEKMIQRLSAGKTLIFFSMNPSGFYDGGISIYE